LQGVKNLLLGAFKDKNVRFSEVDRWKPEMKYKSIIDLSVYAGMPQYGAREEIGKTEENLKAMRENIPKVMNIRSGTSFELNSNEEDVIDLMANAGVAEHYKNEKLSLRTSRDSITKRYFDRIGNDCEAFPCPSFFSSTNVGDKKYKAIALLNDSSFVTDQYNGDLKALTTSMERLFDNKENLFYVAHSHKDVEFYEKLDTEVPLKVFDKEEDLIQFYSEVSHMISFRLHGAVPAWASGAKVVILAFDGRTKILKENELKIPFFNMLDDTGISDIKRVMYDEDSHMTTEERWAWINKWYDKYTKLIMDKYGILK